MRATLKPLSFGVFLSLALMCSCATEDSIRPQVPAEVTMNPDAGRGNWLFVTLRLESGEALPFFIDTGASDTCLDQSLEPRLGKRLGSAMARAGTTNAGAYPAPKLYLGGTQLMTGSYVLTYNFSGDSSYAGCPIMGVLGMDCLKHYCVQLDFEAGKLRFLNPHHLETATLGQAFPLVFSKNRSRPFIHNASLVEGAATNTLIDTGFDADGALGADDFTREVREKRLLVAGTSANGKEPTVARLPQCIWKGETHTNLSIVRAWNALGLRFLGRHLVTFNFPERTMYLKQTRTGPLLEADAEAGMNLLQRLKENGQLPGPLSPGAK